ncbi:hypothetical protein CONPUDRAFT_168891 [Coniophora puteana RWD-64-598 SS2]|uniref:Uncharacterized protein n=1 Tax=Coniophora puteana (strain RWD-64-598) TaxID=741705 RepID=A0A5M3MBY2_CONPW|nr:uncharacterized protein CONPUDRAFT_168891 [Coniophora puteana RWD-64-598 SS2]EIW76330.1 hypothetical protein CONPUDRAFT_168891 [Coniophora puteana RWD-64-598 SS2]
MFCVTNREPRATASGGKRGKKSRRAPVRRIDSSPEEPDSQDRRRHRRRSCSHEDEGREHRRARVRESSDNEDKETEERNTDIYTTEFWSSKGRCLGRVAVMYDSFRDIIEEGLTRDPDVDISEECTDGQNRRYATFKLLLQVAPALSTYLTTAGERGSLGPDLLQDLSATLNDARSSARREDAHSTKECFSKWPSIHWDAEACPRGRQHLGFNNQVTGQLLASPDDDWSDESVRDEYRTGERILGSDEFPAFLWPEGGYDPDDMSVNMFRGDVLLSVYTHIFISRKLAKGEGRSAKKGILCLHDVSFVTFPSICYAATVLHYVLSDIAYFSAGNESDPRDFPHQDFYERLLGAGEDILATEMESLLQWWNQKLFPSRSSAARPAKARSMAARLKDQARLKRRRQQEEARKRASEQHNDD